MTTPTPTPHPHLIKQANNKGISMEAVLAVLRNPGITYPSFERDAQNRRVPRLCRTCGVQQEKWTGEHKGEKIAIAVYTCCGKAITVWADQVETALRPDQIAKGVTQYRGRDGNWRK